MVDKHAVLAMLETWLAPLGYKENSEYKLAGSAQPLSSTWSGSFVGDDITAARRLKKAIQSLNADGVWTELYVKAPDGSAIRAYISGDKNQKMRLTEVLGKKLLAAAKASRPDLGWNLLKKDGIVRIGWTRIIKVVPEPDRSYVLNWDNAEAARITLDKKAIVDKFEQLSAASSQTTTWSV
jgi:hypothetical protein